MAFGTKDLGVGPLDFYALQHSIFVLSRSSSPAWPICFFLSQYLTQCFRNYRHLLKIAWSWLHIYATCLLHNEHAGLLRHLTRSINACMCFGDIVITIIAKPAWIEASIQRLNSYSYWVYFYNVSIH